MNTAPMKILVVDDEDKIHRALKLTLIREPYELVSAYDAAAALCILEQQDDIKGIICDHHMPGVSGLDLLIKVRLQFPSIPALLLTGEASLDLASDAINQVKIQGFLTKPWRSEQLRAILRDMLIPDERPPGPTRQAVEEVERCLRDEMHPLRDTTTGAYIVDDE